jgi:hypothetical protein
MGTYHVIIQKLTLSHSCWFSTRNERSGYLFQGRYKSEPVNDNEYLLAMLRYIHNNPVKIGEAITSWTSYEECTVAPRVIDAGLEYSPHRLWFNENASRWVTSTQ